MLLLEFTPPMSSGARARLLTQLSRCHADRARIRLSLTHGVLGPIAICAVGGVVAVVVLALFLPLVDLINNLS